jgi:hypothetical protein
MKFGTSVLCTMIVIGLAGCALVPERNAELGQVEEQLAYFHRLSGQTQEVQRREFNESTVAFEKTPDDSNRLRLVMTLILPGVPWRDDSRALNLLGTMKMPPSEQASPNRDLARLLERLVGERIQLRREEQRKCEVQKTDEHRKAELLQQKLDGMRDECRKADVLQQKLDELRDIDRNLRKRPLRRNAP